MTARTPIPALNAAFIRLTNNPRPLNWHAEAAWCEWLRFQDPEWQVEDLELVIRYMRARMKGPKPDDIGYTAFSFSFRNLIENPEKFLGIWSDARTEQLRKVPPPTEREKILAAASRPRIEPTKPIQSAGVVLERTKLAGKLAEWKAKNSL